VTFRVCWTFGFVVWVKAPAAGLEVNFKVCWRFGFVVWAKVPAAGLEVNIKVCWRFGFEVWAKVPELTDPLLSILRTNECSCTVIKDLALLLPNGN